MNRYESIEMKPRSTDLTDRVGAGNGGMSDFGVSAILGFAAFSASYLAAMAWIPWMSRGTALATVVLSLSVCLGVAIISYRTRSGRNTSQAL
jgi:hypothetical protein